MHDLDPASLASAPKPEAVTLDTVGGLPIGTCVQWQYGGLTMTARRVGADRWEGTAEGFQRVAYDDAFIVEGTPIYVVEVTRLASMTAEQLDALPVGAAFEDLADLGGVKKWLLTKCADGLWRFPHRGDDVRFTSQEALESWCDPSEAYTLVASTIAATLPRDPVIVPDTTVSYEHPSWGRVLGRVLRVAGETALCQDLSTNGAREWWPLAQLTVARAAAPKKSTCAPCSVTRPSETYPGYCYCGHLLSAHLPEHLDAATVRLIITDLVKVRAELVVVSEQIARETFISAKLRKRADALQQALDARPGSAS